jgi:hypothetical protein
VKQRLTWVATVAVAILSVATTAGAAPSNLAGQAGPQQVQGSVRGGRTDASTPTGEPQSPARSVASQPSVPQAIRTPLQQFQDSRKNLAPTSPAAITIPTPATVTGTVTAGGSPFAGACVELITAQQQSAGRACTDSDGHYTIAGVRSGLAVKAKVSAAGFVDEWAPDRPFYRLGTSYTVTSTAPTVIDFALRTGGTIRGRITDQAGHGVGPTTVVVSSATDSTIGYPLLSRVDGTFDLPNVPVGDYHVVFNQTGFQPVYAFGAATVEGAATFTVTNGGVAEVNDHFLSGSDSQTRVDVKGTVTDRGTGLPIAGASVVLFSNVMEEIGRAVTDSGGKYVVAGVPSGTVFKVRATAPGYGFIWSNDSPDFANATSRSLSGTTPAIDLRLSPPSRLHGRITDPSGGPAPFSTLIFTPVGTSTLLSFLHIGDGSYSIADLPPGDYRVLVGAPGYGSQYLHQRETSGTADIITIAAGEDRTLDEQFAPRGALDVALVDDVDGSPVSNNCVTTISPGLVTETLCPGSDGVVHFTDVPPGPLTVRVSADPAHLGTSTENNAVSVHSGQKTSLRLALQRAGTVHATIPGPGSPPTVCVYAIPVNFQVPEPANAPVFCNIDSRGNVVRDFTIGPIPPGPIQLWVPSTTQPAFGAQWVGTSGGTGDRRAAAVLAVKFGQVTNAPAITLDGAGSVIGTVRDRTTGLPVPFACVRPYGLTAGLTASGVTACADGSGTYRLDGLGPYAWPIEFTANGYANTWSGDAINRFQAKLVTVNAGHDVTANVSLPAAAAITFDRGANAAASWQVLAYSAITHDREGFATVTVLTLSGLNTGPYLLWYEPLTGGDPACWYRTGVRQVQPTAVTVTSGQTIDNLRLVPGETCFAIPTTPAPPRRVPATTP